MALEVLTRSAVGALGVHVAVFCFVLRLTGTLKARASIRQGGRNSPAGVAITEGTAGMQDPRCRFTDPAEGRDPARRASGDPERV